jgi:hypothetical protein
VEHWRAVEESAVRVWASPGTKTAAGLRGFKRTEAERGELGARQEAGEKGQEKVGRW